jgi:hypothetical protein
VVSSSDSGIREASTKLWTKETDVPVVVSYTLEKREHIDIMFSNVRIVGELILFSRPPWTELIPAKGFTNGEVILVRLHL